MEDLISVVIPIYNVEKYLRRCIESVVNQTYKKLEIILINDGSTDKSLSICEEYAKRDKRIVVVNKKNGGLSDARNAGMKIANGEYIAFVDSDDFIERDMYEYLIKCMNKYDSDICICGTIIDYEDGRKDIRQNIPKTLNSKEALIEMNSFSTFDMAVWNRLYRKECVENVLFPVGKNSEDYFVMYQYFYHARKITVCKEAKYHYFQRKNSISRGKKINFDFIDGSLNQKEFIDKVYPDISFVGNTAYAFSYIAVFNKCIENEVELKKDKIQVFRKEVKKYIIDILRNPYIQILKKAQALAFIFNISVYKKIYINLK